MVYRRRDDPVSRSVGLLISVLVRYPEVGTVKYEPRQQTIRMSLLVTGELSEADWTRTESKLFETLEVYHMLEQREPAVVNVEAENLGHLTSVSLTRDVSTLTPEEIYTVVEFFREHFSGRLVTEQIEMGSEEDWMAQDEAIENMLATLEQGRSKGNLIAIREEGRLMMFQK
ncbi:MAG TPA: hypothetical protein VNT75_01795 [Symbiobacteriaceae bacterium]|nr:hypothetical protein [Symbiobacteriaceae bacterium]